MLIVAITRARMPPRNGRTAVRSRRVMAAACRGRQAAVSEPARGHNAGSGQALVETAMVLVLFMLVTIGLLDGLRVVFFYSQVQEAAREGARWGAVQVARAALSGQTPWGTFSDIGNQPMTYCPSPCANTVPGSRKLSDGTTNTIVGSATQVMNGVNLSQATITISTTISGGITETLQTYNDQITNRPVSVVVTYPFKPILGMVFGGVTITLQGSSTMLHE